MSEEQVVEARRARSSLGLKERKGKVSDEILSGLGVCSLSVCGMFVNLQLVGQYLISGPYGEATQAQVAANGEILAATWFISMVVAFLGSLLIGLVARLPFVQTTGLGLSSVLVSTLGVATGLTYYNVLFLSFVGAIVYAVLIGVPQLRKLVLGAIPAPVRTALPAAMGLLIAFIALQLSGLVSIEGSALSAYGTATVLENVSDSVSLSGLVSWGGFDHSVDKYHPLLLVSAVSCVVTVCVFLVAKRRSRHPYGCSLLVGTAVFLAAYLLLVCLNLSNGKFSADSLWARLWMAGGNDAMEFHLVTGAVFTNLSIGAIFSQGLDFSAYTSAGGNLVLLVIGFVVTYVLAALATGLSTMDAVAGSAKVLRDENACGKALACNALANVIAPVLGASPLAIAPESYAGSEDRARSGLFSVVAAVGFLVNGIVMVVPFIFMTVSSYDVTFNMVGHYGFVMQLLTQCGFAIADIVMVLVGLNMSLRSLGIEWRRFSDSAAFVGVVAGTFFTSNIALGVACGTIAYLLAEVSRKKSALVKMGEETNPVKRVGVPAIVSAAIGIVALAFTLFV